MSHKFLLAITLTASSFFLIPAIGHACDTKTQSTLEQEKISFSDLNKEKSQTKRYDFRTAQCTPLSDMQNATQVSEFLPSDETTLGIFQYYIDKGENQYDASKTTLVFNINEEESQGSSTSLQGRPQFNINEE